MGQEPLGTTAAWWSLCLSAFLASGSTGHRGPGPIDPAWAWPLLPRGFAERLTAEWIDLCPPPRTPKRPWAWGQQVAQLACPKLDATNRLSAFGESLSRPCAQSKLHPAPLPQQLASNKRRWEPHLPSVYPPRTHGRAWRTR